MRCYALAEAWQDAGGTAAFISGEMPPRVQLRLSARDIALLSIDAIPGSEADATATIAQAEQLNADWIAVDGDRFGSDFLHSLRASRFHVLLLDDFAERESFPTDIIVNPNLGADADAYTKRGSQAQILTGPHYALLRSEFRQPVERTFAVDGNRVLITLGGSDPENLAPRIASALAECADRTPADIALADLTLTVVLGPGYAATSELEQISGANAKVIVDPQNMAELMANADLAVIAAGGTLWELLASGCVVLSYSRNPVQSRVIKMLARDGIVVDMGATSRFDPVRLVLEVKRLAASKLTREKMASRGRALIDGTGAARVVAAMRNREAPR